MQREKLNNIDDLKPTTFLMAIVTLYFIAMHIGAIAAAWFYTWQGLVLALTLYLLSGLGVTIGYHRLLTHDSFATFSIVRAFWGLMGSLSMQSDPVHWVAFHRQHHKYSDKKGDPHSPLDVGGMKWAHKDWVTPSVSIPASERKVFQERWAPDLLKEPMINFIRKYYLPIQLLFMMLVAGSGWLLGGWQMMWSFFLWGICLRIVVLYHVTWAVNSASHRWGYRNYPNTGDESRNNWLVAILAFGEGWHNNHHGGQKAANHGQKWWEFDLSYKVIQLMKLLGLAWDIHIGSPPKTQDA